MDFTQAALKEIGDLVMADMNKRFANTGVLQHVHILKPQWDDQPAAAGQQPELSRALKAWSDHFLGQDWPAYHHEIDSTSEPTFAAQFLKTLTD